MDFYQIKERSAKNGTIEVYPDFTVGRSKDLMVRGKTFYAIWNEKTGLWSTDEYDVQSLVDQDLMEYRNRLAEKTNGSVRVKLMSEWSTNSWAQYRNYLAHISDSSHQLDLHLTFANTEVKKKDYVSKRLPYRLEEGLCEGYDELMDTLYNPEERQKLDWAIGAIVAGDAKEIQKFIVLYGEAGGGKSTFLNVLQQLFEGYYTTFEAKALTSSSNAFSTEVFRSNPLVALQHDGDLSRIEDNTKLNSVVAHEDMVMNEKYKPSYTSRANCFLFMATNKPVKITDAKSGIIRRLIDVRTSGRKIPVKKYHTLVSRIGFELGAIASKCLKTYREMGKNYYSSYRPLDMIFQTDVFFNFVEANYYIFLQQDGTSLTQAYEMYKVYCDESNVDFKLPRHKFREELKNYFETFTDITRVDGKQLRSYYGGFIKSKFTSGEIPVKEGPPSWLTMDQSESILDEVLKDSNAQYTSEKETPIKKWLEVDTYLRDMDTTKLHYVRIPKGHIVIDFDLKDDDGNKSAQKNIEAATKWPPTYAEFSKSQSGIHLHYIYDGDTTKLSNIFEPGIEIKTFHGDSSLRRKLSKCNNIPVSTINTGLPQKEKKMINLDVVKSEKGLRTLILRNLAKEIHPGTKPSMDFIEKILKDAYDSGLNYDVRDMRPRILTFALNSTNQSDACLKSFNRMKFNSEEVSIDTRSYKENELVFFDVEVFPNLVIVCWKYAGDDKEVVSIINPTAKDVEGLLQMMLVGFNCRRYDNHILYALLVGYTIEQIGALSQKIIKGSANAMFGEAYNISYTDVYDFASSQNKQSLKKWEIDLRLHHQELGLPWDQPVPKEKWDQIIEYCKNDVRATEKVFNHLNGDWVARKILASLSGLTVNDTTNQHTTKIIFGSNKKPQDQFVYTDLSTIFPGYTFDNGKSTYRGEIVGEGGYVYSEPGAYYDVALLDIASMHPTSIEQLNLFGPYTKVFNELKEARLAIKHNTPEKLKDLFSGKLMPFVEKAKLGEFTMGDLSAALKTVILSVYGLTSANFDNPFRDIRNIDNIVAKRGALFMIDLLYAVREKGFVVAHIKTDSIKIPNATKEIIDFVFEFGKKYGYQFEHEATFDRFCLINDAVYIARYSGGKNAGKWTATGAQFAHPYVFKTMFSEEPLVFEDFCETRSVTTALYLDMNEGLQEGEHNYQFIGKIGSFCPMLPDAGGGLLMREKDGKYYAVSGTKGFSWLEDEVVKVLGKENLIDQTYFVELYNNAVDAIQKYIDIDLFRS